MDKVLMIITGVPPTYDDDDLCHITTAFPRTRDEYISVSYRGLFYSTIKSDTLSQNQGAAFDVPYTSIDNLFDGTIFPTQPPDTLGTMLMKGMALLDRSVRHVSRKSGAFLCLLNVPQANFINTPSQ